MVRDDDLVAFRLIVCTTCLALGGLSLTVARDGPTFTFAGTTAGGAVLLIAGGSLLCSGALFWARRPSNLMGPLLVAASGTWFVAEWDNPSVGSSPIFTIGLLLFAACPPAMGWMTLAYPSGRLVRRTERLAVAAALAVAVIALGLLPTLYFDPAGQGCNRCPTNLLLVSPDADRAAALGRVALQVGLASVVGLVGVIGWQLAQSSRARLGVVAPVVIAGSIYLGLVAWSYAAGLDHGFIGSGELERRLWIGQAIALTTLGSAVVWGRMRVGRTRASLARLVVELAETGRPGGLREALARRLGDPQLEVGYPIGDGRFVTTDGRPLALSSRDARSQTPLVRDGAVVAIVIHGEGLLDDPDLVEEVASAARLALENERLHAELVSQEVEMRASRSRIVKAGNAERRRAERDLHDGAQQRLVGLLLGLRLAKANLGTDDRDQVAVSLDEATAELQAAVDDLRELADRVHPAVLSDEGLAVALDSLAEGTATRLSIKGVPQGRFPSSVETVAYRMVADAARSGPTEVAAVYRDRTLVLDIVAEVEPDSIRDMEDWVGAVEGVLQIEPRSGGVQLHAEFPCAGLAPRSSGPRKDHSDEVQCE